ncbi:MAG: hypothetical protein E5V61_06270 [Mesorhizobium sp.]|nr:MAG: hypothetical protein E5V61_06270 [Mesorhizobium sp.]
MLNPNGRGWRRRGYSSSICIWRARRGDNDWRRPSRQPISPLVGEMSGRTEGGREGSRRSSDGHSKPPSSTHP